MSHERNIDRIKMVNQALSKLEQEFVFVGGAVVALYADRSAEEVRETDDVDILVEVYSRYGYAQMDKQLRKMGFLLDATSKFVGRYLFNSLVVDFMPMEEDILGFSNKWYKEGFANAQNIKLDQLNTVKIFTAPYFLAAKLEAFKSRGKNVRGEYDGRMSTDFEDIVFLLVYRSTIWKEMAESPNELNQYIKTEFSILLTQPYFEEWIDSHTGYRSPAAQEIIIPMLTQFLEGKFF